MPEKKQQEVTSFNQEDFDPEQLSDEDLEEASGGLCANFTCNNYVDNLEDPPPETEST